mgnify:CR=1 FL=1
MKKIIIIGAGGFAREVKFLIDEINRKNRMYWVWVHKFNNWTSDSHTFYWWFCANYHNF